MPTLISASERYTGGRAVVHLELEMDFADAVNLLPNAVMADGETSGAEHYPHLMALCEEAARQRDDAYVAAAIAGAPATHIEKLDGTP
jgi:hypothetical protein